MRKSRFCWSLFCLVAVGIPANADNWPQWRGPNNDGHSTATGLPTKFSSTDNLAWKVELPGPGSSTPCIWGDKIFLTAQVDKELMVLCLNKESKTVWSRSLGNGSGKYRNDEGNMASASCSTDGERVFAFAGTGELACFNFEGKELWKVDTQAKYGKFAIQFGAHWTPLLHDGKLYVTLMHRGTQKILCFDAKTGTELWQADRTSDSPRGTESPDVYSSPFLWKKGDQALLIVHGNDYCTAHRLKDGSEVWRVTGLNPKEKYNRAWRAVSSPLVTADVIIVPSCKNGVTVAVDPMKAKGEVAPEQPGEIWRLKKGTPDVPSPIIVGDYVYIMRENGELVNYNLKSGEMLKGERITNERHRANPLAVDGKLYLTGRDGSIVVVKPGKEWEVLAKNKLPDVFTASPAISDNKLYLRGHAYLWVFEKKPTE